MRCLNTIRFNINSLNEWLNLKNEMVKNQKSSEFINYVLNVFTKADRFLQKLEKLERNSKIKGTVLVSALYQILLKGGSAND